MFVDEIDVFVKGGDGGAGCVSFRREAYVPRGGPDGGDGGNGGSIFLEADPSSTTLLDFHYQRHYTAERGQHGKGADKPGGAGEAMPGSPAPPTVRRGGPTSGDPERSAGSTSSLSSWPTWASSGFPMP